MSRTLATAALTGTLVLIGTGGCGGGHSFDPYQSAGVSEDSVPEYQAAGEAPRDDSIVSGIEATLVLGADEQTVTKAKAALADYIGENADRELIEAEAVTGRNVDTFVCSVRYFADESTAQTFRGESFDQYPAVEWNCPNLQQIPEN